MVKVGGLGPGPKRVSRKTLDPIGTHASDLCVRPMHIAPMTTHPNKHIAQQWFDAFNGHDLEGLLALYHENAVHFSPKLNVHRPETQGLIRGKEALRSWWQDAFERLPTLRYEVVKFTADEAQVFMEYIRHVEGEMDLRVGEVLEVKDGSIVASRVYHG